MSLEFQVQRVESAYVQIQRHLRQQIQSGILEPGERLPSNAELARMWRVSCSEVQKALAGLASSGWVARARRRGTFVKGAADQAVIGLLFGPPLTDEVTYLYRALLRALRAETKQRKWDCRPYDGLTEVKDAEEPHHEHALHNLRRDLGNYGFKGLIYISPEPEWARPLEQEIHLPVARWAIANSDAVFDWHRFGRDTVAYLADRGRRRLAFLRTPWHLTEHLPDLDGFWDEIRARGLPRPDIVQVFRTTLGARQEGEIQQAMMRAIRKWQSPRNRGSMPDGLVVGDDVSMRAVALALLAAGVKAPDDLLIVSQANEGVNLHYGVPVARYEFSTTEVARHLVEVLWKRMTGETLPPLPIKIQGHIQEIEI